MTETAAFSEPLTLAGAVMTGIVFVRPIDTMVETGVALPTGELLSTAVQLIVYEPACVEFGVPESVMLGFNAGPAELEAVRNGAPFV